MKLKIEIEMENAAFDGDEAGPEASRILTELAERLNFRNLEDVEGNLRDVNGNKVGKVMVCR
jgi:hypothetical protein